MKTTIEKLPSVDHPTLTFVVAPKDLKQAIINLSNKAVAQCIDHPGEKSIMVYFRDEDDHKMEDIFKLIEAYKAIHS